jgi:hypothetical protein
MEQKIEPLSEQDAANVESQREWVRGHFTPESQKLYDDLQQKLRLLDTIGKNKWIKPNETFKLQCLGITLGDAFVQKMGFEWVTVEDEYGRDPAIRLQGTSSILFPLTMTSKRIEKGEDVDIQHLFEGVCEIVDEKKKSWALPPKLG